jgi:hypothetical protein
MEDSGYDDDCTPADTPERYHPHHRQRQQQTTITAEAMIATQSSIAAEAATAMKNHRHETPMSPLPTETVLFIDEDWPVPPHSPQ